MTTTGALRPARTRQAVPLGELARVWISIGMQSFGGGVSVIALIRSLIVERRGWVGRRTFTEDWALSLLSPGIHVVALVGLLGLRIAGARGVLVSVAALMLPAGVITAAMTAGFVSVAEHPLADAALAGLRPATAGMTIGLAAVLIRTAARGGRRAALDLSLVAAAFVLLLTGALASPLVIIGGAALGGIALRTGRPTDTEGSVG